jgi:hypothetical protein
LTINAWNLLRPRVRQIPMIESAKHHNIQNVGNDRRGNLGMQARHFRCSAHWRFASELHAGWTATAQAM